MILCRKTWSGLRNFDLYDLQFYHLFTSAIVCASRGAALQKFADRIGVQFKVQVEVSD